VIYTKKKYTEPRAHFEKIDSTESAAMATMAITVGGCLWTVAFIAAHEGGFIVTFPEIPDLATRSETAEAVKGIAEDCLSAILPRLPMTSRRSPQ
jgi:predicted RNase H-like HicB family nuclease